MKDKLKIYNINNLSKLLYSTADIFHASGKFSNSEFQNVAIPTIFLKRILDLREDFITNTLIKEKSFLKMNNYIKTLKTIDKSINQAFLTKENNLWFFVTYQDIIDFNIEKIDSKEIEITLAIDNSLKLKTTANNRIEFIKEIFNNIKHKTVKEIFMKSRYFEHYLEDRKKMDILDVTKLFNKFANEHFGININTDLFSTAYIYLISKFAEKAGKNGGEFFTPDEICKLVINCLNPTLNKTGKTKIADIASGSATFLIEFGNFFKNTEKNVNDKLEFYLQEKNGDTLVLGEAGLLLSGFEHIKAFQANTLLNYKKNIGQYRTLMDYVIGNPPYGVKILQKEDYDIIKQQDEERWKRWGEVPNKQYLEWFFVQTALDMINDKGKVGMVLPLGALFKDNSKDLMIHQDIIEGVILLPGNMFQTTGIPTCIIIFNKNKNIKDQNKIFMINTEEDVKQIDKFNTIDYEKVINHYVNRIEKDNFSGYVTFEELNENNFNLSVQRYFFTLEKEEFIDIFSIQKESEKLDEIIFSKNTVLNNIFKTVLNIKKKN